MLRNGHRTVPPELLEVAWQVGDSVPHSEKCVNVES
jgi:hypothetical protein